MRLDAAASRALNVLPQRLDGASSFSLYGIMARGKTAMGKRLLKVRETSCAGCPSSSSSSEAAAACATPQPWVITCSGRYTRV